MRRYVIVGLVFAVLVCFGEPAHSETKFRLDVDRLPPNYKGDDIVKVYNSLKKQNENARKSELETQEQYEKRVERIKQSSLVKDRYIFKHDIDLRGHRDRISYDADAGEISIYILYHHDSYLEIEKRVRRSSTTNSVDHLLFEDARRNLNSFSTEKEQKSIPIYEASRRRNYIGSNAFGVKAKVTGIYSNEYHISFDTVPDQRLVQMADRDDSPYSSRYPYLPIQLKMDVEMYKKLRNRLKALFICEITGIEDSVSGSEATLNRPTEIYTKHFYVSVSPIQVWLFDSKTGDILLKMNWTEKQNTETEHEG